MGVEKSTFEFQAPTFSTSNTYVVGSFVRYTSSGTTKTYRCITAITTAGAWDSSKWVEDNNVYLILDGGSLNINITRDNQSYSHVLKHGFGTIATLAVGTTDYLWTPTASDLSDFWEEVPTQKSRMIDVYLETYNGSTLVGRDIHSITMTLSDATGRPTVSGFIITDTCSAATSRNMILVGKSVLTASQTTTAKHGSSIASTVYTYNNEEYGTIAGLISSLPATTTPTSFTIGVKATDTRGFYNSTTISKTVAKYVDPDVDVFEVVRCNSSGIETASGTYAKVLIEGSWTHLPVSGTAQNTATLQVGYKLSDAQSYTYTSISVTNGTFDVEQVMSWTIATGSDYLFSVKLTDGVGTLTQLDGITLSNDKNIMYVSSDGEELTFDANTINVGKSSDAVINIGTKESNNISIDSDSVDFRNGTTVNATVCSSSIGNFFEGKTAKSVWLMSPKNQACFLGKRDDYGLPTDFSIGLAADNHLHLSGYGTGEIWCGTLKIGAQLIGGCSTHNSGDCNNLTDTGTYYIGTSGSNKPGSGLNGWLESKKYSNNLGVIVSCHQTYTTYTGLKYERLYNNGTWGSWNTADDYIVAQGTSGVWTYRKWNSGIAECWGMGTAYYANTYVYAYGADFPFTFTAKPTIVATVDNYGNSSEELTNNVKVTHNGSGTSFSSMTLWVHSSSGCANLTPDINFYVIGKWK